MGTTDIMPTANTPAITVAPRSAIASMVMADAAHQPRSVLALNVGSSSIRYALFEGAGAPTRGKSGKLELALDADVDRFKSPDSADPEATQSAVARFLDRLEALPELAAGLAPGIASLYAVGHRIVHGMHHSAPELVTPELIADLRRNVHFDPQHLPLEIALMEGIAERHASLPQVACFDTAFHGTMPRVATILPIPRRYETAGLRRYGFHGLSYEFLMQELARQGSAVATRGRVILAHLGNGASLAAVRDGHCIDTSMGFTPASGLVMGTRSGDLDPGVISYLSRSEEMSVGQFETMTNDASGLLGISEISADMRVLLAHETTDLRAAEAVAVFCYQTRKWIGSFAAVLGGLDAIVFAGGIGENLPEIRRRVCADFAFLGISLSEERNAVNAYRISADGAHVDVHVIRTDEERVIAQAVGRKLTMQQPGRYANWTDRVPTGRRAP